MRRGGQRNSIAAQAFCPELSLHPWTGAGKEDEYGNYVQTPLSTQAMSFKSFCEERESKSGSKRTFFRVIFLQRVGGLCMGCLSLLCALSFGCAFARCLQTRVHVCREHWLQTVPTRGQVVLFGNLRYRCSDPVRLLRVWYRVTKSGAALAVREPRQIKAATLVEPERITKPSPGLADVCLEA